MINVRFFPLPFLLFWVNFQALHAQDAVSKIPKFSYNSGLGLIAPDSLFSINFRFRMQSRAAYTTISDKNLNASEIEARIRRLRLRFEGFMVSPKLFYFIQLSFSRGDMDWYGPDNSTINSSPNVLRDAVIFYKPTEHWTIVFGQTKLPGNRQRVVSSGELQFADRSIVNSTFTLDRDFGFQGIYQNNIGKISYLLKGAITSGEGRNSNVSDAGLAYTSRIELLPLGNFTNRGDYFEGDLEREKTPKISIAAGYQHNDNAKRTAGTLGKDLFTSTTIKTFIADFLLKYHGFAVSAEFVDRTAGIPVTFNASKQERIVYVGRGKMIQASYIFANNIELASRYAIISPSKAIQQYQELQRQEIGLGVSKYLRKHRVKLQGNIFHNSSTNLFLDIHANNWNATFQIELGI